MTFLELTKQRYSLRKYAPVQVDDETLAMILDAGRLAPTAANKQPQRIYVLKSAEAMEKARSVAKMMYNAPMALLICYDDTASWKNTAASFGEDYDGGEVDAAIVTTTMMMEATELGVGTLWARGFSAPRMAEAFHLPENIHPVAILLLGYPMDGSVGPNRLHDVRKPVESFVSWL